LSDCHILQNDLNSLVSWANKLGLQFNIAKCHSMTFTRIKHPIVINYTINGSTLLSLDKSVNDLGFVFDPTLSPNLHVEQVCCKALKTLGFVKRVTAEFQLVSPLKALYCSLVRPILEYGSVIWDPHTAYNSIMLERVQRKFLNYVSHILKIDCLPHDYTPVLQLLNLRTLANRRHTSNLHFLDKLLQGKLDSIYLLSQISFNVPVRISRHSVSFSLSPSSTNYGLNEPLRRCMALANSDPSFSYA
jgi:hypothetical protein